ncbi:hypothetical protein HDU67_005021 [Dinochytrium kinnereticum]|nr:hypothetical protein HDU67_005021 [Dinochytrium kinnereticum]
MTAADQPTIGDLLDPTDFQGSWSVEENVPSLTRGGPGVEESTGDSSLTTVTRTTGGEGVSTVVGNGSVEVGGGRGRNIVTPCKTITDVGWEVNGNDLVDEVEACVGFLRDGSKLRTIMNATDPSTCPDKFVSGGCVP